jgi:hypothetical protein
VNTFPDSTIKIGPPDEPLTFVYAPLGVHTLRCGIGNDAKPVIITVQIVPATASVLQAAFDEFVIKHPRGAYADEDHEHAEKTILFPAEATRFTFDELDVVAGVIITGGQPTVYGRAILASGKAHRWSPAMMTDAETDRLTKVGYHYRFPLGARGSSENPASVTGVTLPCLGSLTPAPAFTEMPAVPIQAMSRTPPAGIINWLDMI